MEQRLVKMSRFLSYLLRHNPESEGLSMDEYGWVAVEALIATPGANKRGLTRDFLVQVVQDNDKQRFEFDEEGRKIRARQGHSRAIDLDLEPVTPPKYLYHGTSSHAISSILELGLYKKRRHHVHLSLNATTAERVGARHGLPVVLTIRAFEMHQSGHEFFVSRNGVWLVKRVPPEFIDFPS